MIIKRRKSQYMNLIHHRHLLRMKNFGMPVRKYFSVWVNHYYYPRPKYDQLEQQNSQWWISQRDVNLSIKIPAASITSCWLISTISWKVRNVLLNELWYLMGVPSQHSFTDRSVFIGMFQYNHPRLHYIHWLSIFLNIWTMATIRNNYDTVINSLQYYSSTE